MLCTGLSKLIIVTCNGFYMRLACPSVMKMKKNEGFNLNLL